ncbi:hypothetical protein [Roseovarius indicus]|uniref:Uncharacterized protein n=1 Tax=Roseovarius indicus TaxID=540747 RepID=A0A5P3ADA1_9RHOB|nr:hypothetical protein [Roseovarius indicus]QEW26693.1 hypothetical protein RIdsm_02495 [Roseovarius indicus]SFD61562.1 hypothetical protein SAMN04488031_101847 [Roseovarius indicus]
MTWREEAAKIIADATRDLPEDTPLKERMKVVDAARPHWGGCSWPRKAWQAARRDYLVRYGYQPRTKKAKEREAAAMPLFGSDHQ